MMKKALAIFFLILLSSSVYAKYLKLPDGSYIEVDKKWSESDLPFVYCKAFTAYPQAFYNLMPEACNRHYERIKQDYLSGKSTKAPVIIPLPNGEFYENKKGLIGDALYCEAYKSNQTAFLNDEQVTTLCKKSLKSTDLGAAFGGAFITLVMRVIIAIIAFLAITYGILKAPKDTPIKNGRFIGAIFVGVSLISFPSTAKSLEDFYFGITLVTIFWFFVGFVVGYLWRLFKNRKNNVSNDLYWDEALKEFESSNRVSSLWAKCFADANGDENKAKAMYIKLRVKELSSLRG